MPQQGPRNCDEVWNASRKLGIADRTLKRAKKELKIRSVLAVENGSNVWYWVTEERHSFQDELRRLCKKYGVPIDERYVWD